MAKEWAMVVSGLQDLGRPFISKLSVLTLEEGYAL